MSLNRTRNNTRLVALSTTCALAMVLPCTLHAQKMGSVTISTNYDGQSSTAIPSDFVGLSFEMDDIEKTPAIFSSNAVPLATLFNTLGVKSLRFGGNTGETSPYPSDANASDVNDFCQRIGANLQWLLPVNANYDRDFYSAFASRMIGNKNSKSQTFKSVFEIGNEPDLNSTSESAYDLRFLAYINALISAIPSNALVSGSEVADQYYYSTDLATNSHYTKGGPNYANVDIITAHKYIFGSEANQGSVSDAVGTMMSSHALDTYASMVSSFPATAHANGHPARYSETSSYSSGGYSGASNSFAAALWAADYLGYMATMSSGNVSGLNFHNAGGSVSYNVFVPYGPATSYTLQGEGYGILAFNQLGGGYPVPVSITNPSALNLTAYAVAHTSGAEKLLVINKTYGSAATTIAVTLSPGKSSKPFTVASISYMTAPGGIESPLSTSGITLGGQGVAGDGTFTMNYPTTVNASGGQFLFNVPAAQLAVVYLHY